VQDEIYLTYRSEQWDRPVHLKLSELKPSEMEPSEKSRRNNVVTVEAKLFDANGVLCVDSAQSVRFSLAGEGKLIDNLGTTRGSGEVQLSNGRAEISLVRKGSMQDLGSARWAACCNSRALGSEG
jgi:beta-galactosidase